MDKYDLKEILDNIINAEGIITHFIIEFDDDNYHNEFQYHKSLKIKEEN